MKLDKIDCKILNLLQNNCRISYSAMAKEIGLSVDSTRKRVFSLQRRGLFFPKVQIRPRHFGFPYIVDVKVKIHNYTEKDLSLFVNYLINHNRVAELIQISGQWNYSIVIIARSHEDLAEITQNIRTKYHKMISEWSESLSTLVHKFEVYDMLALYEEIFEDNR